MYLPAQPFYLLSFSALFSGRVVSSNILAMLPMTSSQVHLWSIGLWMLIGVLIISPTAGGGGLGRLRSSPPSPSPSPQVQRGEAELDLGTWTWTRGTWVEVARGGKQVHRGVAEVYLLSSECNFNAMLTRREASTPRRSRGVLVLSPSQHCARVGEVRLRCCSILY